jgi:hypothetical protein
MRRASLGISAAATPAVTLPRGLLIADAWAELGPPVAPLSNASGRPLARTVKLLLDPLVLRPVLNPRFAGGAIRREHAEELRGAILAAGPDLAATGGWFLLLKRARRRAGVTGRNPQDLYFQRCYELARVHGPPGPDGERVAAGVVGEIHDDSGRPAVGELRRFLTDPERAAELSGLLRAPGRRRRPAGGAHRPRTAAAHRARRGAPEATDDRGRARTGRPYSHTPH